MSGIEPAGDPQDILTVVALLTTTRTGDFDEAAQLLVGVDCPGLISILGVTLAMLLQEIELGCADAMIPVEEFLHWLGLSAAEAAL